MFKKNRSRKKYPSDLTDAQWAVRHREAVRAAPRHTD
jgi:hypothetical protein